MVGLPKVLAWLSLWLPDSVFTTRCWAMAWPRGLRRHVSSHRDTGMEASCSEPMEVSRLAGVEGASEGD